MSWLKVNEKVIKYTIIIFHLTLRGYTKTVVFSLSLSLSLCLSLHSNCQVLATRIAIYLRSVGFKIRNVRNLMFCRT
jgi:hypothetical protein